MKNESGASFLDLRVTTAEHAIFKEIENGRIPLNLPDMTEVFAQVLLKAPDVMGALVNRTVTELTGMIYRWSDLKVLLNSNDAFSLQSFFEPLAKTIDALLAGFAVDIFSVYRNKIQSNAKIFVDKMVESVMSSDLKSKYIFESWAHEEVQRWLNMHKFEIVQLASAAHRAAGAPMDA